MRTTNSMKPVSRKRPTRRTFAAEYKLRILREADAALVSGALGDLLRREGLYPLHRTDWRRQRDTASSPD